MIAKQSTEFSTEKNNVITDLNRIYESISSAGKFRKNYDSLMDVISSLNSRCKQYSVLSRVAIKCDVIDNLLASINYDKLSTELVEKIKNKSKPDVGLQWADINGSLSDINLDPFQTDEIEGMKISLPPPDAKKNKKEIYTFSGYQKRAINITKTFLTDFDYFENELQKKRDSITTQFMLNIPYLVNEHYKVVYKAITSDSEYTFPERITINGIDVKFEPKQKEFLKGAVKALCENMIM